MVSRYLHITAGRCRLVVAIATLASLGPLAGLALAAPTNSAPPTITPITPPQQGQTLTEVNGTWAGTAPITYAYQWYDCTTTCTAITGATAQTYTLVASDAPTGSTIEVSEAATDATGPPAATPVFSGPTAAVTAEPVPINTVAPTITGTAQQGQTLSVTSNGTWTSNTTPSYTYQWFRCSTPTTCTLISGQTASTYLLTLADVGDTIEVQVTATNANPVGGIASSNAIGPITGVPANTALPAITGVTWAGQQLSAGNGTWTNTPTSYTYQWEDCTGAVCTPITTATAQTYTLQSSDETHTITVLVTAHNLAGASAAASSPATAVITAPLAASFGPAILGTFQEGQTLTEQHGGWSITPSSYAYQWFRCNSTGASCVPVAGATTNTYALTAVDLGATLVVEETASAGGGSVSAFSPLSPPVTTPAGVVPVPVNTSPPKLSGIAQEGQTLFTSQGSWSNNPGSYSYQWVHCSLLGCADISGATGSSYTVTGSDIGDSVYVKQTATNTGGNSAPVSSSRTAVVTTTSATTLVASPSAAVTDQGVTLVATVTSGSGSSSARPSGTLSFRSGSAPISGCANLTVKPTGQSVTVTCLTSFAATSAKLTAVFTPASGSLAQASTSPTAAVVIGRARTSISLDVPQQVKVGTRATYAATVNPPGTSIGTLAPSRTVEFLDAGKPIAGCRNRSLAGGAATCTVSYANTGTHRISVRYSGDANFGGSRSSTQPVTVISSGVVASTMSWTFGFNPTYTKVLQLTAYGLSSGITISVTCHGHGCPFARHTTSVSAPRKCGKKPRRKCSAPQTIDLTSIFHSHHLGVGVNIVVTITHSGWIGKHYRFTVRSGRKPLIQTQCLAVNSTRPGVGCN